MLRGLPLFALVLASLASAAPAAAHGQAAPLAPTVRGIVVDGRTGTPLSGVRIRLRPLGLRRDDPPVAPAGYCDVSTDAAGAFTCPGVPEGRHTVRASMLGYVQPDIDIVVDDAMADLRIALTETPVPLNETVTVVGDRFATRNVASPGETMITSSDLFALRGVLADDPLRAVQAMPSVSSTDDFTADIVIRGVAPDRTALLIDGTRARTAVHELQGRDDTGSVSLVNSDLLERVTVSPGGRPLRSGDRTSGQVEFSTRDGSRTSTRVRGIAGAAIASVVAEGPLGHANGSAGWIVAGRASYVGWIARRIEPETTTTFVFGDVNAKLTWDQSPRHRVECLALAGRLAIDERDDAPGRNSLDHALTDSGFAQVSSRWQATPSLVVRHRVAVGADRFTNENAQGEELGRGRRLDVSVHHDSNWMPHPQVAVEGGLEFERTHESQFLTRLSTRPPLTVALEAVSGMRETTGGHLGATWTPSSMVTVMSGLRLDADSLVHGGPTASAWALGEWRLTNAWALRGGVTRLHQAPEVAQLEGLRGNRSLPAERAVNTDGLLSRRVATSWRVHVAAYRRVGIDEARLPDAEPRLVNGRVQPASTTSRWDARLDSISEGIELLAQRSSPTGLSGWVAYAQGRMRVHDRVTGERYSGDYDQRHGLNAYLAWRLSYRTALAAKFRYGSNVPFRGYYTATTPAADGTPQYVVGATRNTARLPAYARLDVRVHRAFVLGTHRLTLFAEVLNALNRENWGPTGGRSAERLFPMVPTAGLLVEW